MLSAVFIWLVDKDSEAVKIFQLVSLVIERLNIIFATTFDKYEK